MTITNDVIKKLREKTGAGMMDCKRALEATAGDMEAAIEYLRKKGAAVAQKRADRAAREGMIVTRISANGRRGVMVEINCETDFVGRSDDFTSFCRTVAETIEAHPPADAAGLVASRTVGGKTVQQLMDDLLAKVGEKLDVRRYLTMDTSDGVICAYTHLGSKIGVLVELAGSSDVAEVTPPGRDIAMQIAAMNPMVISRDQIGKDVLEKEMEIYRIQAANEGKPAPIQDKIAQGRLEKFYQEVCLLEQTFIKDPGKAVKAYLQGASKAGTPLTVKRFQRFHLGEETK
jgi:elongation factor Ts